MRAPRGRWIVPGAIGLAGFSAFGLAPVVTASAAPTLKPITAQALLAKAESSRVSALQGTVVVTGDLGLPQLPAADLGSGAGGVSDLTSLLSGSNTLRVWTDGPARSRVAWLQSGSEQDVVRNGAQLSSYSSMTNTVTAATLPAHASSDRLGAAALTPTAAADRFLAAVTPSTGVRVTGTASVAHRAAYLLTLVPHQRGSLISSVQLAIDAATGLPLRVQVFATGQQAPAVSVGYSQLSLTAPSASLFDTTPPPGATVHRVELPPQRSTGSAGPAAAGRSLIGTGWTSVAEIPGIQLGKQAALFHRISRSLGAGRVVTTSLLSLYLAPDGTLFAGAVQPGLLAAVAAGTAG